MTLRAAIIGCGKIGSEFADDPRVKGVYSHAGAYAASPKVRLVAVCDADGARADRCARRWGLGASYTDVARLLTEARPDVVSICTPDPTHAPILQAVLAADGVRGVLAEKPLALCAAEADDLVRLARVRGVKLAVNYIRRYAPGHQRVRDALAEGTLGTVQSVSGLYSGGLVHNGSHWLDLVRWLIGEIVLVQGFPCEESETDPSIDVRLEFVGGARGSLHGCRGKAFGVFEADIVGTQGRVRLIESGHRIEMYSVGNNRYYTGYQTLLRTADEDGAIGEALVNAVEDLVRCIESEHAPRCSGEDGVAVLRVTDAARASIEAGHAIRLGPVVP